MIELPAFEKVTSYLATGVIYRWMWAQTDSHVA